MQATVQIETQKRVILNLRREQRMITGLIGSMGMDLIDKSMQGVTAQKE